MIRLFLSGILLYLFNTQSNPYAALEKKSESPDIIEYAVIIKNISNIYSLEFDIEISNLEFQTIEKTSLTDNFILQDNVINNVLKIALAGINPLTSEGEVVKIKFRKISKM